MMDSDYGANYTALIQSMRNLGKIGKKPPTDLEKLSEAVKHLSSFQRLVEDCSSTLFIKVNGVEVTATNKESRQEIELSLDSARVEVKLSGENDLWETLEDGEEALVYVDNPMFSDCTIRLEESNSSFYSHKKYLTRRSIYFEAMVSSFMGNNKKDINIELRYPKVFPNVLEFIYSGTMKESFMEEWSEDVDLYFSLMWSADYLQIDDLRDFLLVDFTVAYTKSTLFNYQHFPVRLIDLWIRKYCEIARKLKSTVGLPSAGKKAKDPGLMIYSELELLEMCFIWTANSQSQPEVAESMSLLIRKHSLLRASSIHVIKCFINRKCPSLKTTLIPQGLIQFVGDQYPDSNYFPCFDTHSR